MVRVRFAPSPTGKLHIGGLRTALYNFLYARHHDGDFILRIEDTDQTRKKEGAVQDIIDALHWAGLDFDEGPGKEGDVGPYYQSERKDLYKKYVDQLIEQDHAYYAFDTSEEIDQMRERLKKSGNPSPKYDSITRQSMKNSLTMPQDEVERKLENGDEYVVRLKVPRRETIRFEDEVRGYVSFESKGLDDQVLLKSDGMPTYHLANVVDDHLMNISHVIRGEEWLSSTPKHMLLYEYLGWEPPVMAHLPLIMSPSGGKLSKRKAEQEGIPINTVDYRELDYEPEALINFLAMLGWSPGDDREILSLDELTEEFSLERINKSGAVFNYKKLNWYNEQYMKEKSPEALLDRVREDAAEFGFDEVSDDYLLQIIPLMQERATRVPEIIEEGRFFFEEPEEYDEQAIKKWKDDSDELVKRFLEKVEQISETEFEAANIKQAVKEITDEKGVGFGKVAMPLRVAVTGQGYGPDLFPTIEVLGKETALDRIRRALQELG